MCVQRIQAGKLQAKKEGRPVRDGDITTACQDGCHTNAITFGDRNDWPDAEKESEGSELYKKSTHNRAYRALEEIGVKPNIWYQVKVRNIEDVQEIHGHEGHAHDEHEHEHAE